MPLVQLRVFSQTLNQIVPLNIALPRENPTREKLPALYLLHGMGDGADSWQAKGNALRRAEEYGIVIVMPDGAASSYENTSDGRYRDYICEELPEFTRQNFPISADRAHNFIAGCSMGGFGALKLGVAHPEKWSKIGCFSAAHFEYRAATPRMQEMLRRVYSDTLDACDARVVQDILSANSGRKKIQIWHCCGDQDSLRENALRTRDFFGSLPAGVIDYHFETLPGRHDWASWDAALSCFLRALALSKPEVGKT